MYTRGICACIVSLRKTIPTKNKGRLKYNIIYRTIKLFRFPSRSTFIVYHHATAHIGFILVLFLSDKTKAIIRVYRMHPIIIIIIIIDDV